MKFIEGFALLVIDIVLYSSNREVPSDARIAAVVQQTNENELAEVISKLLCSEAI